MLSGTEKDFGTTYKFFPSRHFTYIFNTFVWMQIINFLNSRKIFDEFNIFEGIMKNRIFLAIVAIIVFLQFIIVSFTGVAFQCYTQPDGIGGLTIEQWMICIGFSLIGIFWSLVLRILPDKPFMQVCSPKLKLARSQGMRPN